MVPKNTRQGTAKRKKVFHSKGVTYFNKDTERAVFFVFTLIMLLWGIAAKLGF